MEKLGRMTDAGRKMLPDMSPSGFMIDDDILQALKADDEVWKNFCSFTVLYQRVRIDTIQIKKKPDLYQIKATYDAINYAYRCLLNLMPTRKVLFYERIKISSKQDSKINLHRRF